MLLTKKRKHDTNSTDDTPVTENSNVFKFAGTVSKKSAKQNRFKVISKQRAVNLEQLDNPEENESENTNNNASAESDSAKKEKRTICDLCGKSLDNGRRVDSVATIGVNDSACTQCGLSGNINGQSSATDSLSKSDKESGSQLKPDSGLGSTVNGKGGDKRVRFTEQGKVFNLVDVVADSAQNNVSNQIEGVSSDQITCNSEPMVREMVTERGLNDEEYVYDIYYTNSRDFDFRTLERDLTFEAFNEELMHEGDSDFEEEQFVYGDDEDENDEGNWRNDYPDEDPRYIENGNYNYDDDLNEYVAFESETGNQLADWMSWRCNIDGNELSSDEGDIEPYSEQPRSPDTYCNHVQEEVDTDT
ncbi:hypothetical protein MAR_027503 [Mya arenaria]|uniref:Probable RNA polymerase II nuclear localization protein SLC7A6OS n=1 Tax=Mya arenaria TaxID=6604 RepID=A0ABY7ETP0_MYAAR|nr:hypothetical protein MAR_027503 [Mya arenaria]